jgi:glycosyltransferase involved in cell wall biosynthesis
MVAYPYPPSGTVAAQRPCKFAQYLPEFGWEPVVVACRKDSRQPGDGSFAGKTEARIRLNPLEPGRLLGLLPRRLIDPFRRFFFVPDEEAGWMAALLVALPGLVARFRPNILWASSVPTGSLVAAAFAARRTRCPLVVDFHNEWTRNMYYRPSTPIHAALHRALERKVVETARAVVTLNPLHTEDLRARFPAVRCETIENGCDPTDYVVEPADPARRPMVFTYAGAVYGHQSPEPFLRALEESGLRDVEVRIVGDRFRQFTSGRRPFPVTVEGHLPHRDLGSLFSRSSAFFLCLEPPAARQLPAKLYEYLRAGRPTFAIVPRGGAVEQWLAKTGAGTAVAAEDPEKWAAALREFVEKLSAFQPPSVDPFHRRALTARLAAILDEVRGAP